MPGPAPKPAAQRQRRNRTTTAATLEAGPARKVALPTRYDTTECAECDLLPGHHLVEDFEETGTAPHRFEPQESAWRAETLRWWETIWESPMVAEWVDADVPGLLVLAALVDDFWRFGDVKLAAEIRMQQREYGLSSLARRQLQWEVKRLEGPARKTPPKGGRRRRPQSLLSVLEGRKASSA